MPFLTTSRVALIRKCAIVTEIPLGHGFNRGILWKLVKKCRHAEISVATGLLSHIPQRHDGIT